MNWKIVNLILFGFWLMFTLVGYYGWLSGSINEDFGTVVMTLILPPAMAISMWADYEKAKLRYFDRN